MLRVEPEIIRDYVDPGVVRLAFHHVLDHGDASQLAHRTVECAGAQEPLAFWRMHNLLFERQDALWQADAATVTAFATELGLGAEAFAACLDDAAIVRQGPVSAANARPAHEFRFIIGQPRRYRGAPARLARRL